MTLISVIICTYNRAGLLKTTLESLQHQVKNMTFDYEVLVVDNNSSDDTKAVIETFIPRFGGKLRYLFQPIQGKSMSLNMAIPQAKGDIIAFTDDDVVVDSQWLVNIMACFAEKNCDGVGGRVVPIYPEGTPAWVKENPHQAAGVVVIYDYGDSIQELKPAMELFIGANYAFRKEAFSKFGMFQPDFVFYALPMGEDREFIQRLLKAGKILYYCGKAVVFHPVNLKRLTVRHLIRWHIAAGQCAAYLESKNKDIEFVYLFGAPRYLLKGICIDFLSMLWNVFNRVKFFTSFRGFFRKAGMIQEYRKLAKKE